MSNARRITAALGGRWTSGNGIARCPAHEDRNPSLSLTDGDNGRLLVKCHAGCGYRDVTAALRQMGLWNGGGFRPFRDLAREACQAAEKRKQVLKRSRQAQSLWARAFPIRNTPAEAYLRHRGITGAFPNSLRYIGDCWHPTARRFPALLAYIGGTEGFALHRTYLKKDGRSKADVAPAKAMLGQVKGGAVRLSHGPGPLVVAEGIETGLSLLSGLIGTPATVWAALSAGGMKALRLPENPGQLIIAADGDPVGLSAAEALAERAHGLGWQVSLLPAPRGCDWNDVLTGKAQAA